MGKLKRGRRPPPFSFFAVRSAYRFLPAFFFPPLAFFAIVCYPPLHIWVAGESARGLVSVAAAWHAHRDRRSTLDGTFRILHIRPAELDSEE